MTAKAQDKRCSGAEKSIPLSNYFSQDLILFTNLQKRKSE
jgi:hypothetical protein